MSSYRQFVYLSYGQSPHFVFTISSYRRVRHVHTYEAASKLEFCIVDGYVGMGLHGRTYSRFPYGRAPCGRNSISYRYSAPQPNPHFHGNRPSPYSHSGSYFYENTNARTHGDGYGDRHL